MKSFITGSRLARKFGVGMSKILKGQKLDSGKPMWSLLPWVEIDSVVRVLTFGAKKYGAENWKRVKEGETRYFNAALRHLVAVQRGELIDKETGEPHYAHAICSLLFCFWFSRNANQPE